MFCSSCEDLLCQNGETQFLPQFFDKLYNIADLKDSTISGSTIPDNNLPQEDTKDVTSHVASNSSSSASSNIPSDLLADHNQNPEVSGSITSSEPLHLSHSKDIVYDRWLYMFCIGVIFRGIAYMSRKSYVNSNELYNLFVKCRECLLKAPHIDDVENLPMVEILISPSSPNPGDEKHGFIHSAMRMLYQFTIGITDLQNGVFSFPQEAHLIVLAQIGIINILVKLPPSHGIPAPPGCVIDSSKSAHVYRVLASEERRSLCYEGIWEVIHSTAQELLEAWWLKPKEFCPQETLKPPDDAMDLYDIEASGFTDFRASEGKILAAHTTKQSSAYNIRFFARGFSS